MRGRTSTYYNGHGSTLNEGAKRQDAHGDLPSSSPALYAARDDDDKGDNGAQFDDDTKRGEEANGAPHVAERRVLCAVARLGKWNTGTRDGGAASVQAVRVFALAVGAIADPARHRDAGNGHDGACHVLGSIRPSCPWASAAYRPG